MSRELLGKAHNDLYAKLNKEYQQRKAAGLACADEKYHSWPWAQMFVVRNLKVLYCPIAKNACSSLKRILVELSDIDDKERVLSGDIHTSTDMHYTGIQIKDLGQEAVDEALHGENYLRFAVLRDPSSRLLSAYWEKFVVNRSESGVLGDTLPIIRHVQARKGGGEIDPHCGISFYDFVEFVVSQEPTDLNAHWAPQHTYLEGVNFNALYDFSSLSPLLRELSARAGKTVSLPELNVSNSGQGKLVLNAKSMLPEQLLGFGQIAKESFYDQFISQRVTSYFKKDFDLLEQCIRE